MVEIKSFGVDNYTLIILFLPGIIYGFKENHITEITCKFCVTKELFTYINTFE